MVSRAEELSDNGPTWTKQIQSDGAFVRTKSQFRRFVRAGSRFEPQSGRYHLYVSLACPWAHRTMIVRALKGLEDAISVDVVDHFLPRGGWTLTGASDGATRDSVNGRAALREIYTMADPTYRGSVTVPVLWDRREDTIVSNESSEIIRMLGGEFQAFSRFPDVDLYPEASRSEIDSVNDWVYEQINDGVYRSGFARTQQAYETAALSVFEGLDRAERLLGQRRFLAGDRLTEADVRLFTTLIRFDVVYFTHFKCNVRRISDYPNLFNYTKELFGYAAFRDTTNFEHIKQHYFRSHESINPFRIVPVGPALDWSEPHDRHRLPARWVPAS